MTRRSPHLAFFVFAACLTSAAAQPADPDDVLNALQEQAQKAAVKAVTPSVVLVETIGGSETIGTGQVRKGTGPTTGLVVGADGYVISSAFNFAHKPTGVFVAVPGHKERYVATIVATDHTRMLTLLKIDATGLPVPQAAPRDTIKVGISSLALGRALDPDVNHRPSVSAGIISATGRIWGKAVQTDAKVSPVNYGGPLIDLQGRVIGVLVPASPRATDETAGIEWYDSGIGFAIPLADINTVLPKLQKGQDLKRGLLGINPQNADIYSARPVVGTVAPESTAAKAGIKTGDIILEVDGHPVERQAQVMHLLGPRYEGDKVSLKLRRGTDVIELKDLELAGAVTAVGTPMLGIVPVRDDPEPAVEVRYVFPKSAADTAGVKAGDRISKITMTGQPPRPFSGRDQLQAILNTALPGSEVKLDVVRKEGGKTETLTLKLDAAVTEAVPEELPPPASARKALEPRRNPGAKPPPEAPRKEDPRKPETGLLKRSNASKDREYWVYVPDNYDANTSHALVVWLHPVRGADATAFTDAWKKHCADAHLILVGPKAENETGWIASESDFVVEAARAVMDEYTIDRQRVVAHGMGVGGQMAYYLGFTARDLVRGVAVTGAVLNTTPRDNIANQRLAFYIVAGGKDPLAKDIAEAQAKLAERKFPVTYREVAAQGADYLDAKTLAELVRWIDSLDRL